MPKNNPLVPGQDPVSQLLPGPDILKPFGDPLSQAIFSNDPILKALGSLLGGKKRKPFYTVFDEQVRGRTPGGTYRGMAPDDTPVGDDWGVDANAGQMRAFRAQNPGGSISDFAQRFAPREQLMNPGGQRGLAGFFSMLNPGRSYFNENLAPEWWGSGHSALQDFLKQGQPPGGAADGSQAVDGAGPVPQQTSALSSLLGGGPMPTPMGSGAPPIPKAGFGAPTTGQFADGPVAHRPPGGFPGTGGGPAPFIHPAAPGAGAPQQGRIPFAAKLLKLLQAPTRGGSSGSQGAAVAARSTTPQKGY